MSFFDLSAQSIKRIIIILIPIFLLFFIIYILKDWLVLIDRSKQENPRIGLVNDEPVYSIHYKMMLENYYKKLTMIKTENLAKNDSVIARDSVWNILIKETILGQQIRVYHITVSNDDLKINSGINLQDALLKTNFFNDILETYENDAKKSGDRAEVYGKKIIEYSKLFGEVTKNNNSESENKEKNFTEWYNALRSKAEIHDLRDRFFRED